MKIQPKVSVIIPVYNVEKYLRQCMDSIVNQTLGELEIICVNDGTQDDSLSILEEYASNDGRIRIISQENQGLPVARNRGMDVAQGKYLICLDSDDFFELNMLEEMYNQCEVYSADMCICDGDKYNQVTDEYESANYILRTDYIDKPCFNRHDMGKEFFFVTTTATWNKLYDRKFIENHKLRYQEIRTAEDVYYTTMSVALAEKITYVEKKLVHYRVGRTTNICSVDYKTPLNFCLAFEQIKESLLDLGLYQELREPFLNRVMAGVKFNFQRHSEHPEVYSLLCYEFAEKYIELFELNHDITEILINKKDYIELLQSIARTTYEDRKKLDNKKKEFEDIEERDVMIGQLLIQDIFYNDIKNLESELSVQQGKAEKKIESTENKVRDLLNQNKNKLELIDKLKVINQDKQVQVDKFRVMNQESLKTINKFKVMNQEKLEKNNDLWVLIRELRSQNKDAKELIVSYEKLIRTKKEQCEQYEKELEKVYNSFSYRLGNKLTYIPRKLREWKKVIK